LPGGAAGGKTVTIYTATWCGICDTAKQYFRQQDIPYKEYDIETSSKGQKDFRKLKGTGVPIILIGNKRMNGFTAQRFESLYGG
jgi:glutaredoxin